MKPRPQRVRELFVAALMTADPLRDAFLEQAADGDLALVQEVRLLLEAHEDASGFLAAPALGPTIEYGPGPIAEGPGTVIGPYTLLEQIGEGGMGVVYVAEQARPMRRKVALKIIKPGMDTRQVVARFEAERQALAMMDHPNIAKVLDGGATGIKDEGGRMKDEQETANRPDSSFILFGPPLLRHGAGPRHPDHRLLRPRAAFDYRSHGAVRPDLPGRAARASERDHPPRPQALEHPGDGH